MNLYILLITVLYGLVENLYFGWHWTPMSDAEMVCDGIGLLIFSLAFKK